MPAVEKSENWEIEGAGAIYEASFDELPSWIADGSLRPTDKVRRGNLRWIQASKVPTISRVFVAKENGLRSLEVSELRDSLPPYLVEQSSAATRRIEVPLPARPRTA